MDLFYLTLGFALCSLGIAVFLAFSHRSVQKKYQTLLQEKTFIEATLESERDAHIEKLKLMEEARVALGDSFKALSAEALAANNTSFLNLAKLTFEKFQTEASSTFQGKEKAIEDMVTPLKESLKSMDKVLNEMEKSRVGTYHALMEQVKNLLHSQKDLQQETKNLVGALRTPNVRGRWGEIQLRRVVEMAGMLSHCDFLEQVAGGADMHLRPDMIVQLPGGKNIVVDAKAPLGGYLDALNTSDEGVRAQKLRDHARHIRSHIQQLSLKSYWESFHPTPEFVVLFLPGEIFFSAALEQDPSLIEMGAEQRVILATPTTLIALLRAVAYGWRQEQITKNAEEISSLGRELYKRLSDLGGHVEKLGRGLGGAVDAYNQAVGTLERRVFVTARKFKDLGVVDSSKDIEPNQYIEKTVRLQKSEDENV